VAANLQLPLQNCATPQKTDWTHALLWGPSRRAKAGAPIHPLRENRRNSGRPALYGRLLDVREFSGRYWPSGMWCYLLSIRVERVAEGVIEHPDDPTKWRLPDRRKLEELDMRILPGIRTVKLEQGEKLKELLKSLR
jgi:hypothetical protein